MIQELSTRQWVALAWFASAVLTEIFVSLGFAIWLHRRKVPLIFGMIGVPGYLERRYAQWCRDNGRPSRKWLIVRTVMMVNVIVAIVAALPIFVGA